MLVGGVWGAATDDVWAVGGAGIAAHWDGSSWSGTLAGSSQLLSIWGSSASSIDAGGIGVIEHESGDGWRHIQSFTTSTLASVWGSPQSQAVSVACSMMILRIGISSG